jgi:hypothetical protein
LTSNAFPPSNVTVNGSATPLARSELHSAVQPPVNALGEPSHDDGLLAAKLGELVRLAVTAFQLEFRRRVANLKFCLGVRVEHGACDRQSHHVAQKPFHILLLDQSF